MSILKESKKRELILLNNLCKEHNISLNLAQELLVTSNKFMYENISQSARIKEYKSLLDYYNKRK